MLNAKRALSGEVTNATTALHVAPCNVPVPLTLTLAPCNVSVPLFFLLLWQSTLVNEWPTMQQCQGAEGN